MTHITRDPIDVATDYIVCGRRKGKTTAMIMSLPENERCTIVTLNAAHARLIKNLIEDLRPEMDLDEIKFAYSYDLKDHDWILSHPIRGFKTGPVYIDNSVIDNAILRLFDEANRVGRSHGG